MQTILEYLKRRQKQDYTPGKVSVCYDGRNPVGVEIHDEGHDFVLMAYKRLEECSYNEAAEFAVKNKCRIPTETEWKIIVANMPAVSQALTDIKAKQLFGQFYWRDSHFAPNYIDTAMCNSYVGDETSRCKCVLVKDI